MLFKEHVSSRYLITFHFIESSEVLLLLAVLEYRYLSNIEAFTYWIILRYICWTDMCQPDIGMFYVDSVLPYGNVRLSI